MLKLSCYMTQDLPKLYQERRGVRMDADFLLTRGDDLVVLGVRMMGVTIDAAQVTAVAGDGSRIVIYLPPQHLAEEVATAAPPGDWVAAAQLAGTSRVAFDVTRGTEVPLTTAGILGACRRLSAPARPPGRFDTAVEMPWHLAFAPVGSGDAGGPATLAALHPDQPLASPAGAIGLWLSRLGLQLSETGAIVAGGQAAPEFELVPVAPDLANTADPPFPHSLTVGQRNQIVGASGIDTGHSPAHPRAREMSVTCYGGSLTAEGRWDDFSWRHAATLGRDQRVIITQQGRCYPFGLRVLLTTVIDRRTDTPGSTDEAALRLVTSLRFLEHTVSARAGALFSREFPFSSVEVSQQVFDDVFADYFYVYLRPNPDTTMLQEELSALQQQATADAEIWGPLVSPVWTAENLAGYGADPYAAAAFDYLTVSASLTDPVSGLYKQQSDLAALKAASDAAVDQEIADDNLLSQLQAQGADEATIAAQLAQIQLDVAAVQAAWFDASQIPVVDREVKDAERQSAADYAVFQGLLGTARPPDNQAAEAEALGSAEAADWLELQDRMTGLAGQIQADQVSAPPIDVAARLRHGDAAGALIEFPLLLRTKGQELRLPMPLLFVADIDLPATPVFPLYASLDDPALPAQLDREWTGQQHGAIGLHGEVLDLVGSATPQPQDRHEMHAINILGSDPAQTGSRVHGVDPDLTGLFGATLGRAAASDPALKWGMQVALPALRALGSEVPAAAAPGSPGSSPFLPGQLPLPGAPPSLTVPPGLPLLPGVPAHFDPGYLSQGEGAVALLKTLTDIPVAFTAHADRSGGLAALALKADAISRALGPVQAAGLTSADPSKLVDQSATLLGFRLSDLLRPLDSGQPLAPPKIVSDVLAGQSPVVTMEWRNIRLRDFLALKTYPRMGAEGRTSLLDLSVVSSVDAVDTRCSVVDIDLVFPPENDVVRLTFDRLVFTQHTTPQHADPPQLDVGPVNIVFEGPLTFLEGLQEAVALVGKGANVQARPTGIEASFTLPVPPVSCGVFNLSNVTFRAAIIVPFGGDPVVVSIAFASRSNPFNLSVLALGGGGYLVISIQDGGPSIEASLEFGAMMAVDFVIASAEVHVLGGIRYVQQDSQVSLTGYVRIGGSVDILGLVSLSVELVVQLSYDSAANELYGSATLVIEIDLTLWSDKVELDSGTWTFLGGGHALARSGGQAADFDAGGYDAWRQYRSAFEVTS
jgi:hypothetical protein